MTVAEPFGPNPLTPSPHWFLGEGMLHGVRHAGRILALVETSLPTSSPIKGEMVMLADAFLWYV